ncbi:unnamed protein product, partial [marine sediment metagenome]
FDVGGDFYDFIKLDDSRLIVAIADVMGKGIPAALMMGCFRGAMRAYTDVECSSENMERLISRLNEAACSECGSGEFISLFYGIIDVKDMGITYCNCGHEPAVLIRQGQMIELDKGGLVLGVDKEASYEIETVGLEDGDCLVFYTDGLSDAANFDGEFWGREKLFETAKMFTSGSAKRMVKNILAYRRRFVGLAGQIDDTTMIIVKVDRRAEPVFVKRQDL